MMNKFYVEVQSRSAMMYHLLPLSKDTYIFLVRPYCTIGANEQPAIYIIEEGLYRYELLIADHCEILKCKPKEK